MTTPLGEKMRALRKKNGYTLEKLAELTESSKSYIWELENKNPPRPSAEKLNKIAEKLGVTVDYFFDTESKEPTDAVVDEAFYRQYRNLPSATKEKIRRMLGVMGDDE